MRDWQSLTMGESGPINSGSHDGHETALFADGFKV
jgi:hypothetical protein